MSISTLRREALRTIGELSDKIIKRTEIGNEMTGDWENVYVRGDFGQFRIIYTEKSTILISEGVSNILYFSRVSKDAYDRGQEFYIEFEGRIPAEDFDFHFLLAFLNKTIQETLRMNGLLKKLDEYNQWPLTLIIDKDVDYDFLFGGETSYMYNYIGVGEEDNQIGALLGIKSQNVPEYIMVGDRKVHLIGVKPYGNLWLYSLYFPEEETIHLIETLPRLLYQHKLVYGNLYTPFDIYSDYKKGLKSCVNFDEVLKDLHRDDEWQKIIDESDEMLAQDILFADMLRLRAKSFFRLRKYSKSVDAYKFLIEKYPDELFAYTYISDPLRYLNRHEEGIPFYTTAIERMSGYDKIRALYIRGDAYYYLGDFEKAIADTLICYESEYKVDWMEPNLTEYYILNNQLNDAVEFVDQAIGNVKKKQQITLSFLKMIALMLLNKTEEADEAYENFKKFAGRRRKSLGFTFKNFFPRINADENFMNTIKERGGSLFSY